GRGTGEVGDRPEGDRDGQDVVRLVALDQQVARVGDEQQVVAAVGGGRRQGHGRIDGVVAAAGGDGRGAGERAERDGGRVERLGVGEVDRIVPVGGGVGPAPVGDRESDGGVLAGGQRRPRREPGRRQVRREVCREEDGLGVVRPVSVAPRRAAVGDEEQVVLPGGEGLGQGDRLGTVVVVVNSQGCRSRPRAEQRGGAI